MPTIDGDRKLGGGTAKPIGLFGYERSTGLWVPIRSSDDGLQVDKHLLGVPGEHKFGHNPAVNANEDVWSAGGAYTGFISAASACIITSTDPDDDDGDTGAQTVEITGLDANGDLQTVIATMNGVGNVAIGTFLRVLRAEVKTAGATGTNEGVITVETDPGGVVMAHILGGIGQTLQACYTIPNDYQHGHMVQVYASMRAANAAARAATVALQARENGGAWSTKEYFDIHAYAGPSIIPLLHAPQYDPLTDLRMRCINVSNADMLLSAGFDIKFTPK